MECVKRIAWTVASAWLFFGPGSVNAQSDGESLLRAGNEAFRSGAFADARDAYREALGKGFDSPLLQYNLGVAHYRLRQYAEAELALEKASAHPELEPLATYNLGLTSLAAGWFDSAESRFRRVIEISTNSGLTELATRALAEAQAQERTDSSEGPRNAARRLYREPDPPVGELYFVVAARYGTDDNVYRSPSSAYVDLTQAGQPTITPIKQAAGFMPVDLLAHYSIVDEGQSTEFNFVYRLNGDFYDSEFSNANRITQRFEVGADLALEGRHQRTLEANLFGITHEETNFDPDTGIDRDFGGQDISDRFSYNGAGIEANYEHPLMRWAYGADTRIERRSYDDAPGITPYDHEFYYVDLWAERHLGEAMDVSVAIHSYRRVYDARPARDSTGVLLTANPTLEYIYFAAEAGVERRLASGFSLNASIQRVDRNDLFEGYADYLRNQIRLGVEYRPHRRLTIDFSIRGRTYEYLNAFAFNDPVGGPLDIDSTNAEIDFEYRFNSRFSVWSEFLLRDESSSDPRLTYARNRAIAGIKWRH
jgi:tetratricopeptide (TPR) repeat protein